MEKQIPQARLQQYVKVNFQMFKLDLEKAEESEIKLPISTGSSKKQERSGRTSTLLYWLCQRLWLCRSQQTVEILKEVGLPDNLTCLLRNLYAGQKAIVRPGHGTRDWFQIGKKVHHGCILSLCLFNLYAEYIMKIAGLDEAHAGIKIAGRNISKDRKSVV